MVSIVEKKVVDTASASYVCDTTGSITAISLSAQGTDYTNRIGRKTTNVAVQLQGSIRPIDAATNTNKSRVMIIYDTQPNSALPAITDILTASTSNSFMNLNNRDRFRVLVEENVTLGALDNTATQAFAASPTVHNINIYRKIALDTIWQGTTAAIGSVASGALYLVTIGDQAAGLGGSFQGAVRVRFVDS